MRLRIRAEVEGIVQGVGFRPFVYQLAVRHHLGGFVMNTAYGVLMEVEGRPEDTDAFFLSFRQKLPPLAQVTQVRTERLPPLGDEAFHIRHSEGQTAKSALISPDVAVCADCLREMNDPGDRRHHYPFINCTNCGPRYTIIQDIPYDRRTTTMRAFTMCPQCAGEYHDPADRRFHAQPNACPVCGPRVFLLDHEGRPVSAIDPIRVAAERLREGFIVAVKGLGGFHLAVDARLDASVRLLRSRKHREEKPLAVMAPDLAALRRFAHVTEAEERILTSIQRPIVLLTVRIPFPLAESLAPDNPYIGAMLPYTPLHHLLLKGFDALVMTSGNLSEEPIAIDNDEALARLGGIADFFLMHDRDIYLRSDDSVVQVEKDGVRPIRRSRGYVPVPVFLKKSGPSVLAVGGELKNTVCLTKGDRAFLSQHVGDLENLTTLDFFERTIRHLKKILDIEPEAIAYDLHPEYLSTKWALEQTGAPLAGVQHHHAHIAAVLAEHKLDGPIVGLAADGTGYGADGRVWGGELMIADEAGFQRRGHILNAVLPGGAAAIREPWRMAVSHLVGAFGPQPALGLNLDLFRRQDRNQVNLLVQVIEKKVASPETSSLGRLFDAVAALIGLKDRAAFEGQAAMMLEMVHPGGDFVPYDFDLDTSSNMYVVDPRPVIRAVVGDLMNHRTPEWISGRFHAFAVRALAEVILRLSDETGIRAAALSGGCFQNRRLTRGLVKELAGRGLNVYLPTLVPANDGGLALGQAAAAMARLNPNRAVGFVTR